MVGGMLRKAIRRGWSDTLDSLGGVSLVFTILVIPFVGFCLHFYVAGWAAMTAEFDVWLVYGLAATGLVFIALFAFHIACAPYRIERDRATLLEGQLSAAHSRLFEVEKRKPELAIKMGTVSHGGRLPGGRIFVSVTATVENHGTMPSVTRDWTMAVYVDGIRVQSRLFHEEELVVGSMGGGYNLLKGADAFYNKAETVIPEGGAIRGHLFAFIYDKDMPNDDCIVEVEISCSDIKGNVAVARDGGKSNSDYIPGAVLIPD